MWIRTPIVIQRLFPQILWRMPSAARGVYLTFDDGPDPDWTPAVLELLSRYEARATFFVVGEKVVRHPDLVRAAAAAGHSIASHSFEHRPLLLSTPRRIESEFERADAAIAEAIGARPRLFRPPYGQVGPALLRVCGVYGKQAVLWEINPRDYARRSSPATIARRILTHVRPGSIVLLHDGHARSERTLAALETVLPELRRREYRCLPLAQAVTGRKLSLRAELVRLRLADFAFHGLSKQSSVAA